MSKPICIYVLLEDCSDEVRYVGQTTNPKRRIREHRRNMPLRGEANSLKRAWVDKVHERGATIRMRIVETCTREEAADREAYWVQKYIAAGHRLTNGTETGGPGKWRPNPSRKPSHLRKQRPVKPPKPKKEKISALIPIPPTEQEILDLWIEGWDGFRATSNTQYLKAIDLARVYLKSEEDVEKLDKMLLALPGDYPPFKGYTNEEWLKRAELFDFDDFYDDF